MIIGGVIGIVTFIFQTYLNYFVALILHFIITVLLVIIMFQVNHWVFGFQALWWFVLAYAIIWIVLRLQQQRDVNQINRQLNKRK
ncbi:MAG: DUF3021 domain-containing protein [[Lactobacillus] timonensis]|nr:DUF3021 domain-containing protein [[Lactobacillus] timonensis]